MRRALAALLAAVPLAAAGEPPIPLRHDLHVDGAVTAAAVAAWLGSEVAKPTLAPARCRVCEPNRLDAEVRTALVWGSPRRARRASDVLAFGLLPAGVAAHQLVAGGHDAGFVDLLLVAQATALAADLNQLVKYAVGRQRPLVRYATDPARAPTPDDNLSFFSGHTTLGFSLATAAGTVSTLRGYRSAPLVWGAGLGVATGVGYLRIAGDAHYLTDVLVGAVAGSAIGIAVPRLLHGRERAGGAAGQPARVAVPLGIAIAF